MIEGRLGMADTGILIFATSAGLLLAMPGPTNALLAASGAARGLRHSLPLLISELAGYGLAIGLLLSLDSVAGGFRSEIGLGMRSTAAILLLATGLRMWRAAEPSPEPERSGRAPDAFGIFVLTLFNPKALILGFAVFPPMARQDALPAACILFAAAILLTGLAWIAAGAATRRLPGRPGIAVARLSSLVIGGFACYFAATAVVDLIPLSGS